MDKQEILAQPLLSKYQLDRYASIRFLALLYQRFDEDRLTLVAGSLTFSTVLALVPLFVVILSIFTVFPAFQEVQDSLQQWMTDHLFPDSISEVVMDKLTQFAQRSRDLGLIGLMAAAVTSLSLLYTIDRTLNTIWQVQKKRSMVQRILIYWAALTLGPIILGISISISSHVMSHSVGLLAGSYLRTNFLLLALQVVLFAMGLSLLYRYLPNTWVSWPCALGGAFFAAIVLSLARWGLNFYLARIPTYSLIYGAFAAVPVFLLWIYMAWVVILLGALLAAVLPEAQVRVDRDVRQAAGPLNICVQILRVLHAAHMSPKKGLILPELQDQLDIPASQLRMFLLHLQRLGWVGELHEGESAPIFVLLIDPRVCPLAPLLDSEIEGLQHSLGQTAAYRALRQTRLIDVLSAPADSPGLPHEILHKSSA